VKNVLKDNAYVKTLGAKLSQHMRWKNICSRANFIRFHYTLNFVVKMHGLFHVIESNEYAYTQSTTAKMLRPTDIDI